MHLDLARALRRLATLNGVQPSFTDATGHLQSASPQILCALLQALGVSAGNKAEVRDSLRASRLRPYQRGIEPAVVAWEGRPCKISIWLPQELAHKSIQVRLRFEDGRAKELKSSLALLKTTEMEGERFVQKQLFLPSLPFGCHTLEVGVGNAQYRSLLISAPIHSYAEPRSADIPVRGPTRGGKTARHAQSSSDAGAASPSPIGWVRAGAHGETSFDVRRSMFDVRCSRAHKKGTAWGAFLPMYSLRSEQSWGAGNFSDWERFCHWIGELGGSVAATLPLLAAFLDYPVCEPSPYSPASRLFWNEFYLDITRLPEFLLSRPAQSLVRSKSFQSRLRAFRRSDIIDYRAQWRTRRQVLELVAKDFFLRSSLRRTEFENFIHRRPEVEDYAAFRAVCDKSKKSWQSWPGRLRNGTLRPGDYDESTRRFHLYVQWLAQEQMEQLTAHGERTGVKLYLDLPLGVNPDGYDVWRERESFALEADAGAPPDMFFTRGQNWGTPPLHPHRIRESGYHYVLALLRFQMRHARLLRIDHVMGLHRLYWVPRGFAAHEGTYVNYPAEELQAIFNLESHRHRTLLVGENLGTVPPIVNRSLRRHRLRQMFVVQFEERPNPQAALRQPPPLSVASLNTHDTPTFAAHWHGDDLVDRVRMGLLSKSELKRAKNQRDRLKTTLVKFLTKRGFFPIQLAPCISEPERGSASRSKATYQDARFLSHAGAASLSPIGWERAGVRELLHAILAWVSASPAELVLVNIEDLWLERRPQNVPGTSTERPNWRRKTRFTLEEILQNHEFCKLLVL